jgi:hypothetical protein
MVELRKSDPPLHKKANLVLEEGNQSILYGGSKNLFLVCNTNVIVHTNQSSNLDSDILHS